MTELDISDTCFAAATDTDDYQAVAIGPGLGKAAETEAALLEQIEICQTPMVVDADALNLLGEKRNYIGRLPKGEYSDSAPQGTGASCRQMPEFVRTPDEGSRAGEERRSAYHLERRLFCHCHSCRENVFSTLPAIRVMATGGSGDVLTGVVLALLAQGYEPEKAACLATYVHGLAGDVACKKQGGQWG